jgi:hypothetical protein
MTAWTHGMAGTLRNLGWVVLDHKPRHLIIRPSSGRPLMRNGSPVLGLVDYELLFPTSA